jgi:hypothetical protein
MSARVVGPEVFPPLVVISGRGDEAIGMVLITPIKVISFIVIELLKHSLLSIRGWEDSPHVQEALAVEFE